MSETAERRVVITGRGVLLPWGVGPTALAAAGVRVAAPLDRFDPRHYLSSSKSLRVMHRTFQITVAAATLALREAALPDAAALAAAGMDAERAGTVVAAADFNPLTADLMGIAKTAQSVMDWGAWGEAALHGLHPFRRLGLLTNMAAAHVSILFGLQGPSLTFTSGRSAGAQALRESYWLVREGRADLIVCEAADSSEHLPQDDGVRGEAGAALVFEEREAAERRGSRILAELAPAAGTPTMADGWDAYPITAPFFQLIGATQTGGGVAGLRAQPASEDEPVGRQA